jgi:GGDEF domain-containing protein
MFEWNRPYITAKRKINQPAYQMKTTNKIKRQSITMPVCCADIDAFDLVKTNMGEAWIDKYIYRVATGMVTLNLKYEDI